MHNSSTSHHVCLHCRLEFVLPLHSSRYRVVKYCSWKCYRDFIKANGSPRKTIPDELRPTYRSYNTMKQRCLNPNNPDRNRYGGRGITICERWLASFQNFVADMGVRPPGTTIDRINNDGNYEPGNCRWATRLQQRQNQDRIIPVEHLGKRMDLQALSREVGLSRAVLRKRIVDRGLSVDEALSCPPGSLPTLDSTRRKISLAAKRRVGTLSSTCKLTEDQVQQIRAMRGKKKLRAIAEQFHVGISAVHGIHVGRSWKCLPEVLIGGAA